MDSNFNWNAADFFERLTKANKFAQANGFVFKSVSSLEGFRSLIDSPTSAKAYVAVSDTSQGGIDMNNSPHTRRVKTVFLFMRHAFDNGSARSAALEKMNELFRQFLSVLIQEKTRLEENCVYIDERITFTEIDKYFSTGGSCAFFQFAADTFTNLVYNPDEWTAPML